MSHHSDNKYKSSLMSTYKGHGGLGKYESGRSDPIPLSTQDGKKGLGFPKETYKSKRKIEENTEKKKKQKITDMSGAGQTMPMPMKPKLFVHVNTNKPAFLPNATNFKETVDRSDYSFFANEIKYLKSRVFNDGFDEKYNPYAHGVSNRTEGPYCIYERFSCKNKYSKAVRCASWVPGGNHQYLWSGSASGVLSVWNGSTGKFETHIEHAHGMSGDQDVGISTMMIDNDYQFIMTGDTIGCIKLWSPTTSTIIEQTKIHDDTIRDTSYGALDNMFVSASDDGKVRAWDLSTLKLIKQYVPSLKTSKMCPVVCVDWHPTGSVVLSGGLNHLALWDIRQSDNIPVSFDEESVAHKIRWNKTGQSYLYTGLNGKVYWKDIRKNNKSVLQSWNVQGCTGTSITWHPKLENVFAIGTKEGHVWFGDTDEQDERKEEAKITSAHQQYVSSISYHPVSHVMATTSTDSLVKVWGPTEKRKEREEPIVKKKPDVIPGFSKWKYDPFVSHVRESS